MPDAAAGAHPFDAAIGDLAGTDGRIIIARVTLGDDGHRGNAGVGMDRHPAASLHGLEHCPVRIEDIEKNERLQGLSEVGRAHQPGDEPLAVAARLLHDAPWYRRRFF
nr:hypothetical protein [Mesorhizobium sp.]